MRKKAFLPILAIFLMLAGCGTPAAEEKSREIFAMDTFFNLTVSGPQAEDALDAAEQEIRRLEKLWSVTQPDSELYAINHSGGVGRLVSLETMELIAYEVQMARQTDGALDPTIYPVLCAWGFTTGEYQVPEQEEIDRLLESVGYEAIALMDITVTVPNGAQLDLGAVAKGYTGDRVAELLRNRGITSALLNLGGNVQTIGSKPDGSKWRIGIRSPYSEGMVGVLEVEDMAVVTSGGYERYFTDDDGNSYWHILDPDTGYPARRGLTSVTVVAKEGRQCDALSTALFVMGLDDATAYWREHQDFNMVLITEQGEVYLTEGIQDSFELSMSDVPLHIIKLSELGGNS